MAIIPEVQKYWPAPLSKSSISSQVSTESLSFVTSQWTITLALRTVRLEIDWVTDTYRFNGDSGVTMLVTPSEDVHMLTSGQIGGHFTKTNLFLNIGLR